MRIRLASVNLLHGRSLADGLVDSARMAASVADLDADVIAMQEVDCFQPRSGSVDQTAIIAAEIASRTESYVHWRFVPALTGTPGEQWEPAAQGECVTGDDIAMRADQYPAYGVALISRLPVSRWSTIVLGASPITTPVYVPGLKKWLMLKDEPRVAITAHCTGGLSVSGTHLSFVPGWNVRQLRQLASKLAPVADEASILLGDLNLPAPVPARASKWSSLTPKMATFPGPGPRLQIDHALVHDGGGMRVALVQSRVVPMSISDHLALVVDIDVDLGSGARRE
jgi:endonuclease/exonuclease/phosphatase family metal-dependent hydrolase